MTPTFSLYFILKRGQTMRVEPEIFEKLLYTECKVTYALEKKGIQPTDTHLRWENVPCKEAMEHLERLYKSSNNSFDNETARDVTIQKHNRFLPFLKIVWQYKDNQNIPLNNLYYAIKERNEN
jgi:hypothetical protein